MTRRRRSLAFFLGAHVTLLIFVALLTAYGTVVAWLLVWIATTVWRFLG